MKAPQASLDLLIEDAEHLYACLHRPGSALLKINHALRLYPQSTEALVLKGRILFHLDRMQEMMHCYNRALEVDPKCADAFLARASFYYALPQDYKAAFRDVNKALHYAGQDRWVKMRALDLKGAILSEEDRDEEALAYYRRALRLSPEDHHLNWSLGNSLWGLEKNREALPYLKKALRLLRREPHPHPSDWELAISSLADALNSLGKHESALKILTTGLEKTPRGYRQCLKVQLTHTRKLVREGRWKGKNG